MEAYKVGDNDTRPWGNYVVTAVGTNGSGEEFCEKDITVNPGEILSLQSHAQRREHWKVLGGTLTVILDGNTLTLQKGEAVEIPKGAIHAMANLSKAPVVVHEIQQGLCREADIVRFLDSYGRADTSAPKDGNAQSAMVAYTALTARVKACAAGSAPPRPC